MKKFPNAKELATKTKPGRYAVGHGAYLQISKWGTRSWIMRYVRAGKARHLGLGSCTYVTLAEAREKAHAARREMILNDTDPLMAKRQARRSKLLANEREKSFKQCALDYITAHEDTWHGDHSRTQWVKSFEKHVFPRIGDLPVADIDVAAVLSVLSPIARSIPETASRVRSRIALVLDWASGRDLRTHDNPAKRPTLLPKRKGRRKVQHFAAMPYDQVPAFLAELRLRPEMSARALEFAILTAARPSEALGARWSEIEGNVWEVSADRMKGARVHRVPLAPRVVELLATMPREGDFIFTGRGGGGRQSGEAVRLMLKRMGRAVTTHGFRSSFRDWAAETTAYPNHVQEMALAHAVASGIEAAYRRGDLFEKRRRLMEDWAKHCTSAVRKGEVVSIRA